MFFKQLSTDIKKEINAFLPVADLKTLIDLEPVHLKDLSAFALKKLFSRRDEEAFMLQRQFLMKWLHFGYCPYPAILWPSTAEEKVQFDFTTLPFEDLLPRLRLGAMLMKPEVLQHIETDPPPFFLELNDKNYQRLLPVLTASETKKLLPINHVEEWDSKQIQRYFADMEPPNIDDFLNNIRITWVREQYASAVDGLEYELFKKMVEECFHQK